MGTDMIQVPRRLLEELAGYLRHAGEPLVTVPGQGEWSESMIRELKAEGARFRAAIVVGNRAAEKAGQLVGIRDIAQWDQVSKQQISNDLSAMTKATRRLFGSKKWPFQPVDTKDGMHYLMQPEIAEWWSTN